MYVRSYIICIAMDRRLYSYYFVLLIYNTNGLILSQDRLNYFAFRLLWIWYQIHVPVVRDTRGTHWHYTYIYVPVCCFDVGVIYHFVWFPTGHYLIFYFFLLCCLRFAFLFLLRTGTYFVSCSCFIVLIFRTQYVWHRTFSPGFTATTMVHM